MCIGSMGGSTPAPQKPRDPVPPPPPPPAAPPILAPPIITYMNPEKNPQKRAKTPSAKRRKNAKTLRSQMVIPSMNVSSEGSGSLNV